jgi:hypothetical protein
MRQRLQRRIPNWPATPADEIPGWLITRRLVGGRSIGKAKQDRFRLA